MPRITSAAPGKASHWPQVYLAVSLTSLATLTLELAWTRLFSVIFYYHLAFLAISLALFGLGAGGVFSYVVAGRPGEFFSKLGTLAAVNSAAVPVVLIIAIGMGRQPSPVTLGVIYFWSAIPFFFSGAVLSLVISHAIERVDRIYCFDLLGAAGGCLLLVPLLNFFGGPDTVLAAGIMLAVSSAFWYNLAGQSRGRAVAVALALLLVLLTAINGKTHTVNVRYAKGRPLPHEHFSAWNNFSRVGVVDEDGGPVIRIDADAASSIATVDLDHLTPVQRNNLLSGGPGLVYRLRPGAKTLVIGAGGGYDVARAIASGSKDVTALEINPIIANTIMRQRYAAASHRLYFRPEVHVHVEDGRGFVRGSSQPYQVIQQTLVDTWAATAAGAFALSENNLYTTDAFRDYLNHLTPDGVLVFTRWGFNPPRESLRLVSLAIQALEQIGEPEPWKHVAVLREHADRAGGLGALDTVLIFRNPLSATDADAVRAGVMANRGMDLLFLLNDTANNPFAALLRSPDPARFAAGYPYNIAPVSDDQPFFFYTVQPRDLWTTFRNSGGIAMDAKINDAVPLLFGLVAISAVAMSIILALPPVLLKQSLPREKGVGAYLGYFVFIGAAYVLIQIALIQRFVSLLGHPSYALTVIVFSMLLASGAGSFLSRNRGTNSGSNRLQWILFAVTVSVAALAFEAGPICERGAALPVGTKMLLTACLVGLPAFFMGMPFPIGLSHLECRSPQSVRWAWSLNAAASVVGSVVAMVLAIYAGLRITILTGGALYLCALVLARAMARTSQAIADHTAVPS